MSRPSDLPVGELLLTVFNSILEVFLLCIAGYILARKGVLDKKTQRQLNHLNTSLFTPCLLFSKVALSLTPQKLRELYVLPIFFLLATSTSLLISLVLSRIFGLKRSQKNFAIAASMFMNSNSLPVALMGSLVAGMKGLKWKRPGEDDEGDSKDAMLGRALTYLVLASTMGMILRWSFGVQLLAAADDDAEPTPPPSPKISYNHQPLPSFRTDSPEDESTDSARSSRTLAFPADVSSSRIVEAISSHDQPQTERSRLLRPPLHRKTTYYRSFPNSPTQSVLDLSADSSESSRRASVVDLLNGEDVEQEVLPGPSLDTTLRRPHPKSPKSAIWKRVKRFLTRTWRGFTEFMTIPLYASLLSIVVALAPPLQHALENHMAPVKGALKAAGSCSIPITLVVLGGYFWKEEVGKGAVVDEAEAGAGVLPKSKSSDTLVENVKSLFRRRKDYSDSAVAAEGGRVPRWMEGQPSALAGSSPTLPGTAGEVEATRKKKGRGETKTVVVAILSRMVLTPLVLMPLVVWCVQVNEEGGRMWVPVFEDPIFILSITLLLASPPALTLAQITQASAGGGQAFERLISRTIFWSYCVVTPPAMVLWVVVGLIVGRI